MSQEPDHRPLPTRTEAFLFLLKAKLLQANRSLADLRRPVPRHRCGSSLVNAPVLAEVRTELWNQTSSAEFPLKAGKVQNLRVACRILDGTEIPAGGTFSFWKQLGRTTRRAGYTTGRELRSGCLVPNIGGGLCALSGLLYEASVLSGCEIIERHGHSRILPGMTAEPLRDATIFWNYVDLRFRTPAAIRIEAKLDCTHLIIRFLSRESAPAALARPDLTDRPSPTGDCLSCGEIRCFRHPSANAAHPPGEAHTAFLLDGFTPEHNDWCAVRSKSGDHWFLPLDATRWKKPNYAWTPPVAAKTTFATLTTLLRSFRSRRLPAQGAVRQRALLESEAQLAKRYHDGLSPCAGHLVISQNLLPHFKKLETLGGRTYDVLLHRLPLAELHSALDGAARIHPFSSTLSDFRADPTLIQAETEALNGASALISPHTDLARRFGKRATLIPWKEPTPVQRIPSEPDRFRVFLPCSALARKGVYELAEALHGLDVELLVLGGASEGSPDPLTAIRHRRTVLSELGTADVLVLPAWVEHQPRLALLALASGIPVIASRACGLPAHPLLHQIDQPDPQAIRGYLGILMSPKYG